MGVEKNEYKKDSKIFNEILTLTHTFKYKNTCALYTVKFYNDRLMIFGEEIEDTIKYSKIRKLNFNPKYLKIFLEKDNYIKIPSTIRESEMINELFIEKNIQEGEISFGVAFVEFGEACFFVQIQSCSYKSFKKDIIKRIAQFFYPAYDQEEINLSLFSKFEFYIKNGEKLAHLESNSDLAAALEYFDGKLNVFITNNLKNT